METRVAMIMAKMLMRIQTITMVDLMQVLVQTMTEAQTIMEVQPTTEVQPIMQMQEAMEAQPIMQMEEQILQITNILKQQ